MSSVSDTVALGVEEQSRDGPRPVPALEDQHQDLMTFTASTFKAGTDPFDWDVFQPEHEVRILGSSDPSSECSQDRPPPFMQGNIPSQESVDLNRHYAVREAVDREADTNATMRRVAPSRKRSMASAFSNDQVNSNPLKTRHKVKPDGGDSGAMPRNQLACPFQRLDPHKHHECLKYALHRIRDVKQHIYRRHQQPEYYCARCGDLFANADDRDEHARIAECDIAELPGFEGITEWQRNRLNSRSSRNLAIQDQWFEMWDIIFPGKPRPASAWVGSHMEEMVRLLRSLWDHKSSSILAKVQKGQPVPIEHASLEGLVQSIFDLLEAEASLGKRASGASSQDQHNLVGGQSQTSTPPSKVDADPAYSLMYAGPHDIFQLDVGPDRTNFLLEGDYW